MSVFETSQLIHKQVSDFGRKFGTIEGPSLTSPFTHALALGATPTQNRTRSSTNQPGAGILRINPNLPPSPQPIYIENENESDLFANERGDEMGEGGRYSPTTTRSAGSTVAGGVDAARRGVRRGAGQRGRPRCCCLDAACCLQTHNCVIS
jgi:hypothetical protein